MLATKIIFIDFDGPFSNVRVTMAYGEDDYMDPVAIRTLNHICEASSAKLVCISTRAILSPGKKEDCFWRLEQAGLDLSHIHHDWSCNTSNAKYERYDQIRKWLKDHPEITHYAVIDDERIISRTGEVEPKLVKTSMYDGLSFHHFRRVASLLDFDLIEASKLARRYAGQISGQLILPFEKWSEDHNRHLTSPEFKLPSP